MINREQINAQMVMIEEWVINTYRKVFKGVKRGSMGDRHDCIFKMALFTLMYKEYSLEDILKATKNYVERHINNPIHMRQANYFIFKQRSHQGRNTIISDLLTELEEGEITYFDGDMFDSIN